MERKRKSPKDMDRIKRKLSSNNPIEVLNGMAVLVKNVQCKLQEVGDKPDSNIQTLFEAVESDNVLVSTTASQCLMYLTHKKILHPTVFIRKMVVCYPCSKHTSVIIRAISQLLKENYKNDNFRDKINSTIHPFILLLKCSPGFREVIIEICSILSTLGWEGLSMLKPVFRYALCAPDPKICLNVKQDIWNVMIQNVILLDFDFFVDIFFWVPVDNVEMLMEVNKWIIKFYGQINGREKYDKLNNSIAVYFAIISSKLVQSGVNCAESLSILLHIVSENPRTANMILLILCEVIPSCPSAFLHIVLSFCVKVVQTNEINGAIIGMLAVSLLPWMMQPAFVMKSITKQANIIFGIARKSNSLSNTNIKEIIISDDVLKKLIISNSSVFLIFSLIRIHDELFINNNSLIDKLEAISKTKYAAESSLFRLYLSSLLVFNGSEDLVEASLNILIRISPGTQLPLIMYKLANNDSTNICILLLKALPFTATHTENIPKIVKLLKIFWSGKDTKLAVMSIKISAELWKIENGCYTYLHNILCDEKEVFFCDDVDLAKATIINEISTIKPHIHGEELVGPLSMILTRCSKRSTHLPTSLALDSVIKFCASGVVDIVKTFQVIFKILGNDKRMPIIVKLCELARALLTSISAGLTHVYSDSLVDVITWLFKYIYTYDNDEVIVSALRALSELKYAFLTTKHIPENCLKYLESSNEYKSISTKVSSQLNNDRPIPGTFWINFFENIPRKTARKECCYTIICWLKQEVLNNRGMYGTSGNSNREYTDLKHLSEKTIFRALLKYLLKQSKMDINEIDVEMSTTYIKALNGDIGKHLPPFNWKFLLVFLNCNIPSLSNEVLHLFAIQCSTSDSASECIEGYIKNINFQNTNDELLYLYNILPDMFRGLAEGTMKRLLDSMLTLIFYNSHSIVNVGVVNKILELLKELLIKYRMSQDKIGILCKMLKNVLDDINLDHPLINSLYGLMSFIPEQDRDAFLVWVDDALDVSSDVYWKQLRIRIAFNLDPFEWLIRYLDFDSYFERDLKLLLYFLTVILNQSKYKQYHLYWLRKVKQNALHQSSEKKLDVICGIFVISVVHLTPYSVFLTNNRTTENYFYYFPQALKHIAIDDASNEFVKFVLNFGNNDACGLKYRKLFRESIISLQCCSFFRSSCDTWTSQF